MAAAVYTVNAGSAASLANDPDVVFVSPDRSVHGMLDYSVAAVNANMALQNGYHGKGVRDSRCR